MCCHMGLLFWKHTRVRNNPEAEDMGFWYFYTRVFFSYLPSLPATLVSFFQLLHKIIEYSYNTHFTAGLKQLL